MMGRPARSTGSNAAALLVALGVASAVAAGPGPGQSGHAPLLIPRVKALQPSRSLTQLADWFEGQARPERAFEITVFALLHTPRDPDLLRRAALLCQALGDPASARAYARRVLTVLPGDLVATKLLADLAPPPPAPAGETEEPEEEDATEEEVEEEEAPADAPSLRDKLEGLSLLKLVRSAVTGYNLRHPKTPMETLDLDTLREDKLLPADFDHPLLADVTLDPLPVHPRLGSLGELEKEVGDYRKKLKEADDWVKKGHPHEALRDLDAIQETYGKTPRVRLLRQAALRAISTERAAEEARAEEVDQAGPALERALALWRAGDRNEAGRALRGLAERWPDAPQTRIARRLERLLARGFSLEALQGFYERRRAALASSTTTEAAEGEEPAETSP